MVKVGLNKTVYKAAKERIKITFDQFDKIYVSFSGGKDSSVMLHLVMDEAIKRNKKVGVLFIDLEAQYKTTINHVKEIYKEYEKNIIPYWVCLPIVLRNAVSVYEPRWHCWEKGKSWVRELPKESICDENHFPFFNFGMEFEEFVPKFGKWFSEGKKTACFVGIRTDESLNRWRTIASINKTCYDNYRWTTKIHGSNVYNVYPIYDWKTKDIWIYNSKYKKTYNKLYDLMYQAGLSIDQQRICQPYGDDQRKGLWLYHVIEPETWSKVVGRVNGANSGAEFVKYSGSISGQIKISKPDGHTWESFAKLLIKSMPKKMADHYDDKVYQYISWWHSKGGWHNENGEWQFCTGSYGQTIPDEADPKLEAAKKAPSWRRVCKVLLRNDYWCKGLSFSQNSSGYYEAYKNRMKIKKMIGGYTPLWT